MIKQLQLQLKNPKVLLRAIRTMIWWSELSFVAFLFFLIRGEYGVSKKTPTLDVLGIVLVLCFFTIFAIVFLVFVYRNSEYLIHKTKELKALKQESILLELTLLTGVLLVASVVLVAIGFVLPVLYWFINLLVIIIISILGSFYTKKAK